MNQSAGEGPLTPTLSRGERESNLVNQSAGDGPLTPALSRGERESDLGLAAELAGEAPDDLTTADDGTHPQNDTNEAKLDDDVSSSESQEIDRLMSEIDDFSDLTRGKRSQPRTVARATVRVGRRLMANGARPGGGAAEGAGREDPGDGTVALQGDRDPQGSG